MVVFFYTQESHSQLSADLSIEGVTSATSVSADMCERAGSPSRSGLKQNSWRERREGLERRGGPSSPLFHLELTLRISHFIVDNPKTFEKLSCIYQNYDIMEI